MVPLMALQARHQQSLQLLIPLWLYTRCPLSLCLDALRKVSVSAFLLSLSLLWSALGLHPCKTLNIHLARHCTYRWRKLSPIDTFWHLLTSATWMLGASAGGKVAWGPGELFNRPVNLGDLPMRMREYPQISASCGLGTLPVPFPLLMLIWSIFTLMHIFRIKSGRIILSHCAATLSKGFQDRVRFLYWYKCCCFSLSPSGDRAQNESFCVCFHYSRMDLWASAFPHQEAQL